MNSLNKMMAICLLSLFLAAGTSMATWAGSDAPHKDETCIACHENLYLLRDTGKAYCLCGTQATCTYCHNGILGTMDEDKAHTGMVAYPTKDNAAICHSCHPDDYIQRVEKFAIHGGIRTVHYQEVSYEPQSLDGVITAYTDALEPEPASPWKTSGWAGLGVGAMLVLIFGVRCCREDGLIR